MLLYILTFHAHFQEASGFSTVEAPPPTHVIADGFRFMHQDLSRAASGIPAILALYIDGDVFSVPIVFYLVLNIISDPPCARMPHVLQI